MIDTHTHLYAEQFDQDRDETIARAIEAGVQQFILPAIDSRTHEKMLQLEAQYPQYMHAMMGLHPVDVQPETYQKELETVKNYLDKRHFCAVGEIGIDLYWDTSTLDIQQIAFAQQINWAVEKNLPIVIHSRESFSQTFEMLQEKKHPNLRGIFHCFSGNKAQAEDIISMNFLLGIGGVATFKNGKIDQFLAEIPLQYIVLETDSPYLAPVPFRGKRNESAYLKHIAEKLSEIYQLPLQTIIQTTTENAKRVFNL